MNRESLFSTAQDTPQFCPRSGKNGRLMAELRAAGGRTGHLPNASSLSTENSFGKTMKDGHRRTENSERDTETILDIRQEVSNMPPDYPC
jgi:hypothetical protein